MATARLATEYSVPTVVELTHSAKVAAPRVVETASSPGVEDSCQLAVDWPDTLAIFQIPSSLSVLGCPGVAGKYLGVELELLLPSLDNSKSLTEALVPGVVDSNSDLGRWVVATKRVEMMENKD